ncbi:Lcl C-terminal domain-containing protein [Yoonia maricola]|uniref:Lcl C-terminal domain-containing protein n=1 Tax=Yoonia maricola TaxID=420999 RepID=UPI0014557F70|nr:DUF1566 domain-containing protein [Yoonia maricola]
MTDTGQDTCYETESEIACPDVGDAFFGQDAQFVDTPQSFTDDKDGSVTDNVTSLVWQQDPDDHRLGWQAAQDYWATLDLSGRDDWRVPNLKELFRTSDFSTGLPYLDTNVFILDGCGKDQQFWSRNFYQVGTAHGGAPSAFGVNHATGHIKAYPAEGGTSGAAETLDAPPPPRDSAAEGEEMGTNDFVDVGDGAVLDAATRLMWAKAHAGTRMNWEDALAYVARMNTEGYLGHDDWRLPNIRELQSIVDYSGVFPAVNGDIFETEGADTYF